MDFFFVKEYLRHHIYKNGSDGKFVDHLASLNNLYPTLEPELGVDKIKTYMLVKIHT